MAGYIGVETTLKIYLTNLLNGGALATTTDLNYWTKVSTAAYSYSIDSNSLLIKRTSSSTSTSNYSVLRQEFSSALNNQIVYARATVKATGNGTKNIRFGYVYGESNVQTVTDITCTDTWEDVSFITTNEVINGINFATASGVQQNDCFYIKNVFMINLTAKFGSGNEPNITWCDENIFFDSTGIYYYDTATSKAMNISNIYVGIDGKAKKVKNAYIGVNGVAKLWYKSYTFKDFFESIDSFDIWGQNDTTGYRYPSNTSHNNYDTLSTYPDPADSMVQPTLGQKWYMFYTVGSSLEINKVTILTDTTLSVTRLLAIPTNTTYLTAINSSAKGIIGTQTTYGACCLYLHSTLSDTVIDDIFSKGTINILKGYHSSSASSNATSSIVFADGTIGNNPSELPTEGLIMPLFSDSKNTKTNLWGVVEINNNLSDNGITNNIIKGGQYTSNNGGVWNTNNIFLHNTTSGYYYPCNSNNYISTRGYTAIQFID